MAIDAGIFSSAIRIESTGSNVRLHFDGQVPDFPSDNSHFSCAERSVTGKYIDLEVIDTSVLVAASLNDLILKLPMFPDKNKNVYLIDAKRWLSTHEENSGHSIWSRYITTAKLASLLESISDFQKTSSGKKVLTLIGASRLEVMISYDFETLADCDMGILSKTISMIEKPGSIGFASSIIKNNAIRLMRHSELPDRFAKLTSICSVFCENCLGDHAIYCNGDGYSKAVSELVKSSTDLIKSLNAAFSAMYGKLLLVPAAFIFLHIKMSETTDLSARSGLLWVMALFILVTIATAIMHFRSISALQRNVATEKANLLTSGALPKERVDNSFSSMLTDIKIQGSSLVLLLALYIGLFMFWSYKYSTHDSNSHPASDPGLPPASHHPAGTVPAHERAIPLPSSSSEQGGAL